MAALALGLRLHAVSTLPIDYDEDDYLRAAQEYAGALQAGDLSQLTQQNYRPEHPPLMKLAFGLAIAPLPPAPLVPDRGTESAPAAALPQPHLRVARDVSVAFAVIQVAALALLNPLAGALLAIHTFHIKYTSQVMLEALPSATALLCVLLYARSRRRSRGWLAASAVMLGLTASAKYLYCVAGAAVALDWLAAARPAREELARPRVLARWLGPIAAWGALALAVFFATDPYLWPDPIARLRDSVFFHGDYAQSEAVARAGYPPWQPLVWLMQSVPWHRGTFAVSLDVAITLCAAAGAAVLWRRQRVHALWLGLALAFLLIWPTKWPQYILILVAPLTLAAAAGVGALAAAVGRGLRKATRPGLPRRIASAKDAWRALPWLAPGAIVICVITLFPLIYQSAMALTDFSTVSIRDGLNGGVWRAVWEGLTGQAAPVDVAVFGRRVPGFDQTRVHYAGFGALFSIMAGLGTSVLVFDVLFTVLSVGMQTGLGVGVALLLNRPGVRFKRFWRTLFILPWAVPEFVGALAWLYVFEPDIGLITTLTGEPLAWRSDSLQALAVLLVANAWLGFPFMLLAATAGLKMVSPEVMDAAAVDGATGWQRLRWVTLPLLQPLVVPALIIRVIFTFNQFYLFYVLRPPGSMVTLSLLSYQMFNITRGPGGQFAVSAALNVFTVIVLAALVLWFNRRARMHALEGVTYV